MITKVKKSICRLISAIEQLAQKVSSYMGPALKVGKIIAAIHSVYAVTVMIGCGILGYPMRWLTEYPGADLVMEILAIMTVLKLLYPGIQIDDAKQLRKQLRSGELLCSIDSKLMDNLLHAAYTNTGCCKGETMLNDRTKYMQHAARQDLQMGFNVPKSEL